MAKEAIDYRECFVETMERMSKGGLLMVTQGKDGRPNIMTIGWGTMGIIWGRPIFIALVRPSRYTYSRMEEVEEFTVNVPSTKLAAAALHCGTVSGRDHDKFAEMGLTAVPAQQVEAPIIEECHIHYECRSRHKNDLIPELLDDEIRRGSYPQGDYHRLYFGEILTSYADSGQG